LRKSLLANLSDINAMGGRSRHAFFNLGARQEWGSEVFEALGVTLREMESRFDFRVSGGDTLRLSGPGFFTWTVLGEVRGRPLLRSACAPGHRIYVSGFLGGSAAGLSLLNSGSDAGSLAEPDRTLIEAHLDPAPPLGLGPVLAALDKPVGAIDISDGLSSELWHLERQSGCAFRVEWSKLPMHPALGAWGEPDAAKRFALDGGEEYQLLFTGDFSEGELESIRGVASITAIGEVEKGTGVFLTREGKTTELPSGGYSH
jgi:thiamine-monophosphate kinase